MRARIVDIEDDKITIKTDSGKFVTMPKKIFKFSYHINQIVTVEKNGGKIYVLPEAASFWDDDERVIKSTKRRGSNKTVKIMVTAIVVCVIAFIPIFIFSNIEAEAQQRAAKLDGCLAEPGSGTMKDLYIGKIECYEKYGDKEASANEITENKRRLEEINIQECLNDASENYKVTEEERVSAGNDLGANLILVKRYGEGFAAQKKCYTEYGKIGDYSSEISKIEADIKENQSMVEYTNNAQEAQKSYNSYVRNSSVNCTTNQVGSFAYTNCY